MLAIDPFQIFSSVNRWTARPHRGWCLVRAVAGSPAAACHFGKRNHCRPAGVKLVTSVAGCLAPIRAVLGMVVMSTDGASIWVSSRFGETDDPQSGREVPRAVRFSSMELGC